ncbi:MAG: ornithine--oxo-acid transaminase [Haliangiales bacterium]
MISTSNIDTSALIATERQFGAHNYKPLPVVIRQGRGAWVKDVEGRDYLDMLSAYSALSFGHCHPDLLEALSAQLQTLTLTSRAFYNDQLPLFCKELAALTRLDKVLPMNTGAEAVETAIKAARKWGYDHKGVAADSARIIVFADNFHGRTTTIVGFSTSPETRDGFGPYDGGFDIVPYGDLAAVERAMRDDTVAVLVEPIQGEGGINIPPAGFLAGLRDLCRDHNALLICDEIQTGLGRTGALFDSDHEGVTPDLLILGKALGGGILPLSAVVGREAVMSVFQPGTHGSTFGGNPLAVAVGRKVVDLLANGGMVERSATLGQYLQTQLEALARPYRDTLVKEVRGRGMLIGLELTDSAGPARHLCEKLVLRGVLCKDTSDSVVRFAPPFVIAQDDIDFALKQVALTLEEMN